MKVSMGTDKRAWHPSPLPGQVVLVTSLTPDGRPSVATKSWISMVAFGPPPILMFGCNRSHATARNVLATGEFVVNVPGVDLSATAWAVGSDHATPGVDRFDRHGLSTVAAEVVAPPRVAECHAHLECKLDRIESWGEEVGIFGQIVAGSIDRWALGGDEAARYGSLSPFFFLESGWLAPLGWARRVGRHRAPELEATARRWMTLWQGAGLDPFEDLHPATFVDRSPDGRSPDREGFRQAIAELYDAVPDFRARIEDLVVDKAAGRVTVRWTATGTHRGELLGHAGTGRALQFRGIEIIEIVDHHVVARWGEWDGLDLVRQMSAGMDS